MGFAPERQSFLKSVFRPMAPSAATIRNLLTDFMVEISVTGNSSKLANTDMPIKPKINQGKMDLMLTLTALLSAFCFLLKCRLMAANTSTAGMMDKVLVSFTMVAKSPAASLKA